MSQPIRVGFRARVATSPAGRPDHPPGAGVRVLQTALSCWRPSGCRRRGSRPGRAAPARPWATSSRAARRTRVSTGSIRSHASGASVVAFAPAEASAARMPSLVARGRYCHTIEWNTIVSAPGVGPSRSCSSEPLAGVGAVDGQRVRRGDRERGSGAARSAASDRATGTTASSCGPPRC